MTASPGGGLGQRLVLARARHLHSQRQAAQAAGVSRSVWSHIEHDGAVPRQATVLGKLAAYIGCDPADLMPGGSSVADDAEQAVVTGSQETSDGR